ncbi:MAG: hypothetical protein GY757_56090 [bacterium]|nr:hypothetical protein [bacterium]
MRILADENLPGDVVNALISENFDVQWIRTISPGINDQKVLQKAQEENRILITFDKDFGELAFKYGLPASCGIVLFRIPVLPPGEIVTIVVEALKSRSDWQGHFSVVEQNRIRMRPILRVLKSE